MTKVGKPGVVTLCNQADKLQNNNLRQSLAPTERLRKALALDLDYSIKKCCAIGNFQALCRGTGITGYSSGIREGGSTIKRK